MTQKRVAEMPSDPFDDANVALCAAGEHGQGMLEGRTVMCGPRLLHPIKFYDHRALLQPRL
jgi:hypothetical protein